MIFQYEYVPRNISGTLTQKIICALCEIQIWLVSGFWKETEPIECVCIKKEIYFKEMAPSRNIQNKSWSIISALWSSQVGT
jgi:hypothetical protein